MADHQADHLFLLVGGNPLPNVVAGRLMVKPQGHITLFHSAEGTSETAQALIRYFKKCGFPEEHITQRIVAEWNPADIYETVRDAAKEAQMAQQNIGLHYTGGTKAMSTHAYRAVWEVAGDEAVYSYLDAPHWMVVEEAHGTPIRLSCEGAVPVEFGDLMKLHKFGEVNPSPDFPVLPRTAMEICRLNSLPNDNPNFNQWGYWQKCLRENPDANSQATVVDGKLHITGVKWRNVASDELKVSWPGKKAGNIGQMLRDELDMTEPQFDIGKAAQSIKETGEDLLNWIGSMWLESAVQQALIEANYTHNFGLTDIRRNIEPQVAAGRFELDVVAMRGHRLFAFSCGTAGGTKGKNVEQRGELKRKLFEVCARGAQLGGSHACVALVCRSGDAQDLETEVRSTLDHGGRIKVFGRTDLADLPTAIGDWIEQQSK